MVTLVGNQAIIRSQAPVQLPPNHEPEPDFAVVHFQQDEYQFQHPQPQDIILIIEVADSSLNYDQTIKRQLYAQAGIPNSWIVNLPGNCLEVYRLPQPSGSYAECKLLSRNDRAEIPGLGELPLEQVFA
ncbi:MAG: Uma2 family endonuclease [Thermostichales cyanobacterium BF4_bins_65]